jgi:hypothetical protein
MRTLLIAAAALSLVAAVASAQEPVRVWAGQTGPYEVHTWQHRTNNFDRAPYFATNPPVYYGDQRLVRSYGWTPYPYFGSQYPIKNTVTPMNEGQGQEASTATVKPAKKKGDKVEKTERKPIGT